MHNITERDGLFVVRQPAWHGLGEVLPEYPTREQAQTIAHNWEPVTEPVFRKVPSIGVDAEGNPVLSESYEQIEGYQATVRSDDGHTLGVVSDTYEPVKNSEMYDIAEVIEGVDKGSVRYETGGSLKGGKKVWLLLRLNEPLTIKGDPRGETIPYFALQNGHDGSAAFRGQALCTRIVCDNTSQMADIEAEQRGTEFAFHHTANVAARIEQAKDALAGWRESVRAYRLTMETMATQVITPAQRALFVDEFIPMPALHTVSDRVVGNVEEARGLLRQILASETCEGIDLTTYGLVQASVEYLQHARKAKSNESRFQRAYLDRNRITTDAVNLAREIMLAG